MCGTVPTKQELVLQQGWCISCGWSWQGSRSVYTHTHTHTHRRVSLAVYGSEQSDHFFRGKGDLMTPDDGPQAGHQEDGMPVSGVDQNHAFLCMNTHLNKP